MVKFVIKVYFVFGCFDYFSEDLFDMIYIGGRIVLKIVWDYVGKFKFFVFKEFCLICFYFVIEEEEVVYIFFYFYFSSCGCFGVVVNNNRYVKDFYLILLSV